MKNKVQMIWSILLFIFFFIIVGITLLPLILLALASLHPGSELMRNGLSFNIDIATASIKTIFYSSQEIIHIFIGLKTALS